MLRSSTGSFGAFGFGATKSPAIATLQRALVSLALATRDNALAAGGTDGLLGKKTLAGVNRALVKYVGNAAPDLRIGRLTFQQVRVGAEKLAGLISNEAQRREGSGAPVALPAPPVPKSRALVQRLQRGMRALADVTKDRSLYIATDGVVGPGTTQAVNRALLKYVSEAPPQWRTGKLSVEAVKSGVMALIPHVETALARLQKEAQKKPAPPPAPPPAKPTAKPAREAVTELQRALYNLGTLLKDNRLKIPDDGVIAPKTVAAVNYAFTKYIGAGEAPDQFRTGLLTLASVAGGVDALTGYVQQEVARAQADIDKAREEEERVARLESERKRQEQAERARVAQDSVPATPTPERDVDRREMPAPIPAPPPGIGPVVPATITPPPPLPDFPDAPATREEVPSDVGPAPGDDAVGPLPVLAAKPFPTGWVVGIGGGVAVLGLVAYLIWGGKGAAPRPRVATDERRPEPRPRSKPKRRRAVRRPQREKAA